jgi:ribosomal protein S18 acetylase RimI-like enzyme
MVSEFGDDVKWTVRRYAVRLLAEEKIRGYLAFDDDKSIAWCNAGNMDDYVRWIPDFARQNACGKTMSIVCFAIAPEYRGMGVATALLERVISDARAEVIRQLRDMPKCKKTVPITTTTGRFGCMKKLNLSKWQGSMIK